MSFLLLPLSYRVSGVPSVTRTRIPSLGDLGPDPIERWEHNFKLIYLELGEGFEPPMLLALYGITSAVSSTGLDQPSMLSDLFNLSHKVRNVHTGLSNVLGLWPA